ncbi:recombinase RecA (plasmid) [Flagellatimonas centrodinii]|uniref:recombinase RecA n=1 Tax=Flagellatimonas centrodinii TaxID=2806210 RepID=UPI001FFDE525|nr:recombinase RecA [Flagellatimonas centrodinii]ULQ48421.1 recombinase RecA [Flagellatimonas centrodinii]
MTSAESCGRDKALQTAIASLDKRFGKGKVFVWGDKAVVKVPSFSSGSLGLDQALGINGLPRGRVVEVFGPESSGKTTLALHAIAQVQAEGGVAAFVDAEHALDPSWASRLGVQMDRLVISQPDNGEEAMEIVDRLVASCAVDLVVVDSVAALVPKKEIEGEMGDAIVGVQARLMSQGLRKLVGSVHNSNTTVLFINQLRMKIGAMPGSNPETTTGGNALKFYASIRLDVRRIGAIKDGDEMVGHEAKVKVVKNKLAPPFKQAIVPIYYDRGICMAAECLEHGVTAKVIEKSGVWYSFDGERLGQGVGNCVKRLREDPSLLAQIMARIRTEWGDLEGACDESPEDKCSNEVEQDSEA